MDRFSRSNHIKLDENVLENDIDMQIIEWWAQDEQVDAMAEDTSEESDDCRCKRCDLESDSCKCVFSEYTIRCFGVTKAGASVTCTIKGFKPFFYVKVSDSFNSVKLHHFLNHVESSYCLKGYPNALAKENGKHKSIIVKKKDIFGFTNGREYKFVKLVFSNYVALMKSRYIFKKPVHIQNVTKTQTKFKLYESNFEGYMRYCHIKEILMAGWIKLPFGKYSVTSDSASTQLEVEIDRKSVISLREKQDIAPFLQASWDIEVYSHDYTFPDPNRKIKKDGKVIHPNVIFQIATTYKYYNDDDTLVKHLLTLKKCAKIDEPNVIVEECKTEKELIKKWVDTIANMDPDIFYTYNGDSFDCMYLIERAVLHGLLSSDKKSGYVVEKLSRLQDTSCVIKKEYFSSSAYGDSEFNRLYIPGRLNYDLLIHYKRGMTKYPSYKLDYIANEILKEGKHEVGVKEIFGYYEDGSPEKIKEIGAYCIQDTELLQKLVDKQLILTNIMQLANVTYVPIGFLTTKGQTIKVYSQLLRKARQLDFLVPHTNFNENSYPVFLKTKEIDILTEDDIGSYADIETRNTTCENCTKESTYGLPSGRALRCSDHRKSNDIPKKRMFLSAKISEIIDDSTCIALSDTEINGECYNIKMKHKRKEFVISRMWSNEDAIDNSFTGATVLEPNPGMYTDNIAVLDFASLYPTIMISRNLCYSTFVMSPENNNLPGVNYETIAWDDKVEYKMKQTCGALGKSGKSKGKVCGKPAFFELDNNYFCRIHDPLKKERLPNEKCQKRDVSYNYTVVQPHTDENGVKINQGVLPAMLEELYSERKKVKRQMAVAQQDGNKMLAAILDSTQLAIKVSLNSTYGFLGRCQGNLILKELGSIVTSVGRNLIEQSKEYAEGPFLQYVRDKKLLTHKLETKALDLSEKEQDRLLKRFKCTL
jgi:DNA polymerase elongation subunit (family B)